MAQFWQFRYIYSVDSNGYQKRIVIDMKCAFGIRKNLSTVLNDGSYFFKYAMIALRLTPERCLKEGILAEGFNDLGFCK
jgi:hypothetical protein